MIDIESHPENSNEFRDNDLVCYCFQHTKKDIERDYLDSGRSLIYEKIAAEKKAGGCNCKEKNPKRR